MRARGLTVAPAKTGPDYLDTTILARAAGAEAINLDPWAMAPERLAALARRHAAGADLVLIEGVMGLHDGAADGQGSTADLAAALGLPVVLVVDAAGQGQSVAPLVHGFSSWRPDVNIAGLVLNRVAGRRHGAMLREALVATGIPVLGLLPRQEALHLPERHLGLVLPGEMSDFDTVVVAAARNIADTIDLDHLLALAQPLASHHTPASGDGDKLPPLGQRIAIARDDAFAFLYRHWLEDWHAAGAELSFFSPLADAPPAADADAIILPGGYPELHAGRLAAAANFRSGLIAARDRGTLIYGECGGFMVLGQSLTDQEGITHAMTGLLPLASRIDRPRRVLGYRRLQHRSPLPWPPALRGHEFHYSSADAAAAPPLFAATDARGDPLPPMGLVAGRVMGSYAHVVDQA